MNALGKLVVLLVVVVVAVPAIAEGECQARLKL